MTCSRNVLTGVDSCYQGVGFHTKPMFGTLSRGQVRRPLGEEQITKREEGEALEYASQ
jgi:hypothetical protein